MSPEMLRLISEQRGINKEFDRRKPVTVPSLFDNNAQRPPAADNGGRIIFVRQANGSLQGQYSDGAAWQLFLSGSSGLTSVTITDEVTVLIEDPSSSEDITIWNAGDAKTVTGVQGVLQGGTVASCTVDIKHANDRSAAGTSVLTAATAITSTTTGTVAALSGTPANLVIAADDWTWIETSAGGGTGTLAVTIKYSRTYP
jgi:hypothetical protein